MNKIPILMELVAGSFLGIDLFAPKWGNKLGNLIINRLPNLDEAKNPFHRKTILFNSLVTFYIFSIILIWALLKDTASNTHSHILYSVFLYSLGSFGGAIFITLVASLISKYANIFQYLFNLIKYKFLRQPIIEKTENQLNQLTIFITWLASLFITLPILYVIKILTPMYSFMLPVIISSLYVLILLPVAMMYSSLVRQFMDPTPKNGIYVISRIGFILFISAKLILLAS